MKLLNNLFPSSILILALSCNGSGQKNLSIKHDSSVIRLNNRAMASFAQNLDNPDSIMKSISLLTEAIQIDSSYQQAYANKAILLCHLEKHSDAENLLDRILKLNPDLTEFKSLRGFIIEHSGNMDRSMEIYKSAIADYDLKIEKDSENVGLKLNRAFLYLFTDGYERGMQKFNELANSNPGNKQIEGMKDQFISFNRKEFIKSICSNQ